MSVLRLYETACTVHPGWDVAILAFRPLGRDQTSIVLQLSKEFFTSHTGSIVKFKRNAVCPVLRIFRLDYLLKYRHSTSILPAHRSEIFDIGDGALSFFLGLPDGFDLHSNM